MSALLRLNLVSLIVIFLVIFVNAIESFLGDKPTTSFSFTISSIRNSTGHRHVKCEINVPENKRRTLDIPNELLINVQQGAYFIKNRKHIQIVTSFSVLADERRPPPGYELVPGVGWYRLHLTPLTWEEARLACEAEDAHLAVLNSQEEANALKRIFAMAPNPIPGASWSHGAFIGILDVEEGQHLTLFGERLEAAGYAQWEVGEPSNAKTDIDSEQNCGEILRKNGKINDVSCSGKLAYFCEYE